MNKDLQKIVNFFKYDLKMTSLLLIDKQEVILDSSDIPIPFQFRMMHLNLHEHDFLYKDIEILHYMNFIRLMLKYK